MRSQSTLFKLIPGLFLAAALMGCSTAAPAPTQDIQASLVAARTQAVQTVIAGLTASAPSLTPTPRTTPTFTLTPSATPTATSTASPTPTITATFIPWTATPTRAAFACTVTSFSPALNASFLPDSDFDAVWVIKNTGTQTWLHADIDIYYSTGTRLQKVVNGLDLKNDVASGESYTAAVDMRAPSTVGTYSTTWVVARGSQVICSLPLTIIVK